MDDQFSLDCYCRIGPAPASYLAWRFQDAVVDHDILLLVIYGRYLRAMAQAAQRSTGSFSGVLCLFLGRFTPFAQPGSAAIFAHRIEILL